MCVKRHITVRYTTFLEGLENEFNGHVGATNDTLPNDSYDYKNPRNQTKMKAISLIRSCDYLSYSKIVSCCLYDQSVYVSFYSNEAIYNVATMPVCILIVVALTKEGSEAIAESFYVTMRA